MTVTFEQVTAALMPDEVDYQAAASLGVDALPHLAALIAGDPATGLPAKAAYLAGLIDDPRAGETVAQAVASPSVLVRLAAAATLGNLRTDVDDLAAALLDDQDPGVRRLTLSSLAKAPGRLRLESPVVGRLRDLVEHEAEPNLRQMAVDAVRRLEP